MSNCLYQLSDYDYSYRLAISSSSLSSYNESLLILKITMINSIGEEKEEVIECNMDELDHLLKCLKSASTELKKMKDN